MSAHSFILSETIKETEVMEITMMFFPNEYKNIPLEVWEENDYIISSFNGLTEKVKITSNKKNATKKSVYTLLSKITKKTFPWGTLTGVKPVFLIRTLFEKLNNKEDVFLFLIKEYLMSEEKALFLLEIYENQKYFLFSSENTSAGLYIHIPFCPSKCKYCSFPSYICKENDKVLDNYLSALIREIEFTYPILKENNIKIDNIYIGGGTPTVLNENQCELLLNSLDKFNTSYLKEFTVEAGRIDTISNEKLQILKNHNVGRICLNPQSTIDKNLEYMGRNNSFEKLEETFNMARSFNHFIINSDMIAGFPNQTITDFMPDLERLLTLKPDNITIHSLAKKRSATFEIEDIFKGFEETNNILNFADKELKERGYKPYYLYRQKYASGSGENVGYALNNKECIYNIRIMSQSQSIIGIGAGSTGRLLTGKEHKLERIETVKEISLYINNIDEIIKKKKEKYLTNLPLI